MSGQIDQNWWLLLLAIAIDLPLLSDSVDVHLSTLDSPIKIRPQGWIGRFKHEREEALCC